MNRSSRTGYTLIEMSAVLGVCSILAGISVWLVHMSMQKTRNGQRHLASRQAVARLAETFRRDVHAAISISQAPVQENGDAQGDSVWILRLASDNDVRYRLEPKRVIREEFPRSRANSAGKMSALSRETFELLETVDVSISLEPRLKPRMASLLIEASDADSSADQKKQHPLPRKAVFQSLRVDAAVSIEHRFQKITMVGAKPAAVVEGIEK